MVMGLDHARTAAWQRTSSWALLPEIGPNPLLDLLAEVSIDVAPILEHPRQHRLFYALQEMTNDVVGQAFPRIVVEHFADHGAGLAPVVILGAQGVRGADHL